MIDFSSTIRRVVHSRSALFLALSTTSLFQAGCINDTIAEVEQLVQRIGEQGGMLAGRVGTAFEGVRIEVPPGAVSEETELREVAVGDEADALPEGAVRCGPMFDLQTDDPELELAQAVRVTLPFDPQIVAAEERTNEEVKVWVSESEGWGQERQLESDDNRVTVSLGRFTLVAPGVDAKDTEY